MTRRRVSPPGGATAYLLEEATRRREAEERIVAKLRAASFREAMVPSADYLAPYAPHLDAREERELYRFVDRHGDTLALRADFTIALARHLGPSLPADGTPVRVFYRGEVLRGGVRDGGQAEFYQIGAELLGDATGRADAEIALRCLEALAAGGVGRTWFVLSAVGALERLLSADVEGDALRQLASAVRDRRLADAARLAGRISPEVAAIVRRLVEGDLAPDDEVLRRLGPAADCLARVARSLSATPGCSVAIDLAEPAARSYYTGFFFTVYVQSGGEPIAGGGRYDELYGAFGPARPAVGFALGLEGVVGA